MVYRVIFCYRSQIPEMLKRILASDGQDSPGYENFKLTYESFLEQAIMEWGDINPRAQYQAEMFTWLTFCT